MSEQAYPGSIFSLTDHEIYVVTARHGERTGGQIATWIMPATLVPDHPRIVAVISPRNFTHGLIEASGRFAVNLLAAEQHELLPLFGLHSGRDTDKFEGMQLDASPAGIPLLQDTCGWAECRVLEHLDAGDRRIYYAEVTAQHVVPDSTPLRKQRAFAAQPPDILKSLQEKHRDDGERDRAFLRSYPNLPQDDNKSPS